MAGSCIPGLLWNCDSKYLSSCLLITILFGIIFVIWNELKVFCFENCLTAPDILEDLNCYTTWTRNHKLRLSSYNENSTRKKKKKCINIFWATKQIVSFLGILTTEYTGCFIEMTDKPMVLESCRHALVKSIIRKSIFCLIHLQRTKFIEAKFKGFNHSQLVPQTGRHYKA